MHRAARPRAPCALPAHAEAALAAMLRAGVRQRLRASHAARMAGIHPGKGGASLVDALAEFRRSGVTAGTEERYRKSLDAYILALADEDGAPLSVGADGHLVLQLEHLTVVAARSFLLKCVAEMPSASYIGLILSALKHYSVKLFPDDAEAYTWLWKGAVPEEWSGVERRAREERWSAGASVAPIVPRRLRELHALCGVVTLGGAAVAVDLRGDGHLVSLPIKGLSDGQCAVLRSEVGDVTHFAWAAYTAFGIFARSGELLNLTFADLEFAPGAAWAVVFRNAKTLSKDARTAGIVQRVFLPARLSGLNLPGHSTGDGIDTHQFFTELLRHLLRYHGWAAEQVGHNSWGIPEGLSLVDCLARELGIYAVLERLSAAPSSAARRLFGERLQPEICRLLVKAAAETFGWPVTDAEGKVRYNYTTHSIRHGAASTARAVFGTDLGTVRALGRWQSDAYKLYIDAAHPDVRRMAASVDVRSELSRAERAAAGTSPGRGQAGGEAGADPDTEVSERQVREAG
eukprot:gene9324-25028_t